MTSYSHPGQYPASQGSTPMWGSPMVGSPTPVPVPVPSISVDIASAPTERDTVAHAEVVALPAVDGEAPPDGAVQLAWLDNQGYGRRADVVKWWKLDRGDLSKGDVVRVDVQARQRRHMSSPPHHLSATLIVTGVSTDEARVMIGNCDRQGSWAYGVIFHGAILISSEVPTSS